MEGATHIGGTPELKAGICDYRPDGECTLVEAVELVRWAIAWCRGRSVERLLVVATDLTGVSIPSLIDRYLMAEEWADAADGMVRVALVIEPKYIHPEKFGVTVAIDFGLTLDVFSDEARAQGWLAGSGPPTRPAGDAR